METETLELCPICETEGVIAPDIWGIEKFFHKIESPRISGYYSFTDQHNFKK